MLQLCHLTLINMFCSTWTSHCISHLRLRFRCDIARRNLFPQNKSTIYIYIQLTLVISNSMGPWKKFESTVVRLKRSYEDTGSMVCLTTKGIQLERNFEELKPASHVPILGTILNIRCFCCCFFSLR